MRIRIAHIFSRRNKNSANFELSIKWMFTSKFMATPRFISIKRIVPELVRLKISPSNLDRYNWNQQKRSHIKHAPHTYNENQRKHAQKPHKCFSIHITLAHCFTGSAPHRSSWIDKQRTRTDAINSTRHFSTRFFLARNNQNFEQCLFMPVRPQSAFHNTTAAR